MRSVLPSLQIGAENVLAVISTTSCLAAEAAGRRERRSQAVQAHARIPLVVNHAYGLQDAHANKLLCSAGALTPYPDACSNTADGKR